MQEMKKDFEEMLTDLVHGDIDDEECHEIIAEINEMRKEDDDDEDYEEDEYQE